MSPIILIAAEAADWGRLAGLIEAGSAPHISKLADAGRNMPIAFSRGACMESDWTTLATGKSADLHGILYPLRRMEGGLLVQAVAATAIRVSTLFDRADRAGKTVACIGWPVTFGLELEYGWSVAPGLDVAPDSPDQFWPIAPNAIVPKTLREVIRPMLLRPEDIPSSDVELLLGPYSGSDRSFLARELARIVAANTTRHVIGTFALSELRPDLLAIHFPFVADVRRLLKGALEPSQTQSVLMRCYQLLDQFVGRYMALAGRTAHIAFVSNARAAALSGPEQSRKSSDAFAILTGDENSLRQTKPMAAVDFSARLAQILGINRQEQDLPIYTSYDDGELEYIALAPVPDDICLPEGLSEEGTIAVPDFGPLFGIASAVRRDTLIALAVAKIEQGDSCKGERILRKVYEDYPDHPAILVAFAEHLLLSGQSSEAEQLLHRIPELKSPGLWTDVAFGLLAFSRQDWIDFEPRMQRLLGVNPCPINVHVLLGRMCLETSQPLRAIDHLIIALERSPFDGYALEGLADAWMQTGQPLKAITRLEEAAALRPSSTQPLMKLAQIHRQLNNPQGVTEALWRASQIERARSA